MVPFLTFQCDVQVADLRLTLQRAEQQQARKEDYLRAEISELQQVTDYWSSINPIPFIESQIQKFFISLICFNRGFKKQRLGTRSSVRVLPQQQGPFCDRLRTCRPRWVDKRQPGKNWRRIFLIGLVGCRVYCTCKILGRILSLYSPLVYFNSRCPDTVSCCCGEGACGGRGVVVL